eukprot:SAG31_NODE_4741_length_2988_cov_1.101419_1_plen_283_part_00
MSGTSPAAAHTSPSAASQLHGMFPACAMDFCSSVLLAYDGDLPAAVDHLLASEADVDGAGALRPPFASATSHTPKRHREPDVPPAGFITDASPKHQRLCAPASDVVDLTMPSCEDGVDGDGGQCSSISDAKSTVCQTAEMTGQATPTVAVDEIGGSGDTIVTADVQATPTVAVDEIGGSGERCQSCCAAVTAMCASWAAAQDVYWKKASVASKEPKTAAEAAALVQTMVDNWRQRLQKPAAEDVCGCGCGEKKFSVTRAEEFQRASRLYREVYAEYMVCAMG